MLAHGAIASVPFGACYTTLSVPTELWNIPRTWIESETTTANLFNQFIRDQLNFLITPIDTATGKIKELSANTLVSLSGTQLTGVGIAAAPNAFTGRNDFGQSAARVVIPVGSNLYDGFSGNKTSGSIWVDGTGLHYVDASKVEWNFIGALVAAGVAGAHGSIWVDTDNKVHYVDANGDHRKVDSTNSATHTDAAASSGSIWINDFLYAAGTGGVVYQSHADTHTDGTVHSDVAHTDAYSNSHSDTHTDHSDHSDTAHSDSHTDTYSDHTDGI